MWIKFVSAVARLSCLALLSSCLTKYRMFYNLGTLEPRSPHDGPFFPEAAVADLEVVVGALLQHRRRLQTELVEAHLQEADVVARGQHGRRAVGVVRVRERVVGRLDHELGGAVSRGVNILCLYTVKHLMI